MIEQRYVLLPPVARPDAVAEHEQNLAKIAERFNDLPVNTAMFSMTQVRATTVVSPSTTDLYLPSVIQKNQGFKIPTGATDTTITCEVAGWYHVMWEMLISGNSTAGYRQTQIQSTNVPTGFAQMHGHSAHYTANTSVVFCGAQMLPLKVGSTMRLQGHQDSGVNQTFNVSCWHGYWIRPYEGY